MRCLICNEELKQITSAHLKKHNITPEEYKRKFNIEKLCDEEIAEKRRLKMLGDLNPSKKQEVKEKIKNSVKKLWDEGTYKDRINGMLGKFSELHPNYKEENHTILYLAEKQYVKFLSNFQDITKCSRCGRTDIKMNVHHIDENRKNFLISNLEPLCVPCHTHFHYKLQKQPYIEVGRLFNISAAHFLPYYNGNCKNLHGHLWKIELCIRKRVDKKTGMVMDFKDIKKYFEEYIIKNLDHTLLNDLIINPTAENLLIWIWEKLMFDGLMKGIHSITIWETDNNKSSINITDMLSVFSDEIEDYLKIYGKHK